MKGPAAARPGKNYREQPPPPAREFYSHRILALRSMPTYISWKRQGNDGEVRIYNQVVRTMFSKLPCIRSTFRYTLYVGPGNNTSPNGSSTAVARVHATTSIHGKAHRGGAVRQWTKHDRLCRETMSRHPNTRYVLFLLCRLHPELSRVFTGLVTTPNVCPVAYA